MCQLLFTLLHSCNAKIQNERLWQQSEWMFVHKIWIGTEAYGILLCVSNSHGIPDSNVQTLHMSLLAALHKPAQTVTQNPDLVILLQPLKLTNIYGFHIEKYSYSIQSPQESLTHMERSCVVSWEMPGPCVGGFSLASLLLNSMGKC